MKQSNIVARRSMKERVLHATLFELIAVVAVSYTHLTLPTKA